MEVIRSSPAVSGLAAVIGELYGTQASPLASPSFVTAYTNALISVLKDPSLGIPGPRSQVPLPAATQWEIVEEVAGDAKPAWETLLSEAAQGTVLHNDDTSMTVLELAERTREEALAAGEPEQHADREGVRTSGIVSRVGAQKVALTTTGQIRLPA